MLRKQTTATNYKLLLLGLDLEAIGSQAEEIFDGRCVHWFQFQMQ